MLSSAPPAPIAAARGLNTGEAASTTAQSSQIAPPQGAASHNPTAARRSKQAKATIVDCSGSAMVVNCPRLGNAPRMIAQLSRPLLTQTQARVRMYQISAVPQRTLEMIDETLPSN